MRKIIPLAISILTLALGLALVAVGVGLLGWPRFADYTQILDAVVAWRLLATGVFLLLAFVFEPFSSASTKILVFIALLSWLIFGWKLDDLAVFHQRHFPPLNYRVVVPFVILALNGWYWLLVTADGEIDGDKDKTS